ncbi:hypothetical protein AB0D08_03170 [Kitasatospora sp. NPDC048540]|uniref:Imm32 family immunity protein n=1 Tax=unclassified Kitasatospora TaxID=2633591 RepID=UPI000AD29929|nr:hypothetical protein [Kitasatospora sp. MBT63]
MTSEPDGFPVATVRMTARADGVPLAFGWDERARINVRSLGGEVVVEADAAGLRTLAAHLLALAADGTPDGSHLHLEAGHGLVEGSVGLVLERDDEA